MGIWKLAAKTPYVASLFCAYMLAEGMWEPGSWEWGAAAVAFLILGLILNHWNKLAVAIPKIRFAVSNGKQNLSFKEIIRALMPAAALFFIVVLIVRYAEITEWYWSHPDMSAAETDRAVRECEMKAYEALGGGAFGINDRLDYINACMGSQGFARQKVEP